MWIYMDLLVTQNFFIVINNIYLMLKQSLALMCLIAATLAACPANYNINSLVAGKPSPSLRFCSFRSQRQFLRHLPFLYLQLSAAVLHCPCPRPWYLPPHAAVQDFSINYLSANNFAVYPSSVSAGQVAFQFDFSSPVWSRVKVNFWASNNPQIQLGYFKVGTPSFM